MNASLAESDDRTTPCASDDLARLQGVWIYVAGPRHADLEIQGDRFTVRFGNGDVYCGVFTLDPASRPRAMDMFIHEGPEHHRGKKAPAIYALDSNRLIWYPSEPGSEVRAAYFPARDEKHSLCLVFRRGSSRV
jgi:uncharacterized protein (TIGR03067 family)